MCSLWRPLRRAWESSGETWLDEDVIVSRASASEVPDRACVEGASSLTDLSTREISLLEETLDLLGPSSNEPTQRAPTIEAPFVRSRGSQLGAE